MIGHLEDKVALVTGAGSGIGRASAQAFAKEGAIVAVADIDVAGGETTVDLIKNAGGEAIFIMADVTQAAEVEAMVNKDVRCMQFLNVCFSPKYLVMCLFVSHLPGYLLHLIKSHTRKKHPILQAR